ncbi:MAG: TRAP transporter large permease subunit [Mailhella sp.]|nr:TRAP transporter large permease subunit [Mailhella sp.]
MEAMNFNEMLGMISLLGMFAAFCTGFPISFIMIFAGLVFGYIGCGKLVFYLLTVQFDQVMNDAIMGAIPPFLLMGYLLDNAGLMDRLFRSFQMLLCRVPGSLYTAVIGTGTIFAAATGIVGSSVNLLCVMAEPGMRCSGYDIRMGAGSIAAAGTLGILIPPSVMLVTMGPIMGVPVTDLFAAAILPGLMLAGIYIGYSLLRCAINPSKGPALPKEMWPPSVWVALRDMVVGVMPLIALIGSTLGCILAGIATPTEAASCGAFGALLLLFISRRFSWFVLKDALFKTANMTAMILIMIASCNFFGAVFSRLGSAAWLSRFLVSLDMPPMIMLALILVSIFLLGWAMEWIPIVLIFMPLILPTVEALHFDKLWFCIVFAVTLQTSWLSPPVALSAYFIKGAVPHWELIDIYKGMFQYIGCQVVGIVMIILFPQIITWLPMYLKQ